MSDDMYGYRSGEGNEWAREAAQPQCPSQRMAWPLNVLDPRVGRSRVSRCPALTPSLSVPGVQ